MNPNSFNYPSQTPETPRKPMPPKKQNGVPAEVAAPSSLPTSRFSPTSLFKADLEQEAPAAAPKPRQKPGADPLYSPDKRAARNTRKTAKLPKNVKGCPAQFLSTTHRAFPMSKSVYDASGLEFGVIVEGFPLRDEGNVPVVDSGSCAVVRCKTCRAYINPYAVFESESSWICNLCDAKNSVPGHYKCSFDENGEREDRLTRPELSSCCYEIIAPSEYSNRPPQAPIYLFLIDVTSESVRSGLLQSACDGIKKAVSGLKREKPRAQVVFATFDGALHFYRFREGRVFSEMSVSPDLSLPCVPPLNELIVSVREAEEALLGFLDQLVFLHPDITETAAGSALGPALKTLFESFKHLGGKIVVFAAATPSAEPGDLRLGAEAGRGAQPAQKAKGGEFDARQANAVFFSDPKGYYKGLANELNNAQFSVDVFYCPRRAQPVNAAALGELAKGTGGAFFVYQHAAKDADPFVELKNELFDRICAPTAWESVMRLRASQKVVVSDHLGFFTLRNGDLMCFPVAQGGATVAAKMHFGDSDDAVVFQNFVFIQSALLYTNDAGERRIRVYNVALPTASSTKHFTDAVDVPTYMAFAAKRAAAASLAVAFSAGRALVQRSGMALISKICVFSPAARDELPALARHAALLTLGLLKSRAFCEAEIKGAGPRAVPPQERFQQAAFALTASAAELALYASPLVFALLDVLGAAGFAPERVGELVRSCARPLNSLAPVGCPALVAFSAQRLLLRLRRDCGADVAALLFGEGAAPADGLRLRMAEGTALEQRMAAVVAYLRARTSRRGLELAVVVEGADGDREFEQMLFEERTESVMSFDEFLKFIVKTAVR